MNQLSTKTSKRLGIRLNGRIDDTVTRRQPLPIVGLNVKALWARRI
jgi:hypothetical protein